MAAKTWKKWLRSLRGFEWTYFLYLTVFIGFAFLIIELAFASSRITFDEFEHLHAAWLVHDGKLPYRDFFEHHTPLIWYTFAPLFDSYHDTIAVADTGRYIMLSLSLLCLLLLYDIGRQYHGHIGSMLAVIFLMTQHDFVVSAVIIRPMMIVMLLWLAGLRLTLYSIKNGGRRLPLFAAGILAGVAFGYHQSAAILWAALPASVLAHKMYARRRIRVRWEYVADTAASAAGFAIPILALLWFFHANNALGDFIFYNITLNAKVNAPNMLKRLMELSFFSNDTGFWLLGLSGITLWLLRLRNGRLDAMKVPLLTSVFFGFLFLFPNAIMHHHRIVPLAALAAIAAVDVVRAAYNTVVASKHDASATLIAVVLAYTLVASVANPIFNLSWYSNHTAAFEVLGSREGQEKALNFIWDITAPRDTVFDFSGMHIFRKDAYKTWFFFDYTGGYSVMNTSHYKDLPTYLSKTAPKVAVLNSDMMTLSKKNLQFIGDNFQCAMRYEDAWEKEVMVLVASKTIDQNAITKKCGRFTILATGEYDVITDVPMKIAVDGRTVKKTVFLKKGPHTIKAACGCIGDVTFTLHHPPVEEKYSCRGYWKTP